MSTETVTNFMQPPPRLSKFPAHERLTERIAKELAGDSRVNGIYLSGSFAYGEPDMYSDLDFYILVDSEVRQAVVNDHGRLRAKVGKIVSDFPAIHLGDPHQFIVFYQAEYPVHVDYQYRAPEELAPRARDRDVIILLDRSGVLEAWKVKCASAEESNDPTAEQLQYFEDRFWAWCIYTDGKIRRGELWEARDAIEYLRNQVLVRLAYFASALPPEGNRRLEKKFPREILNSLESTLQQGHSPQEYAAALLALTHCYADFMQQATSRFGIAISEKDRDYFRSLLSI